MHPLFRVTSRQQLQVGVVFVHPVTAFRHCRVEPAASASEPVAQKSDVDEYGLPVAPVASLAM